MKKLLAAGTAFGIIPGGSEDVAIHEHGKENVYINSRYGFIKYSLQHGYCLVIAYTFGETDQYHSLTWLRPLNLWLVKALCRLSVWDPLGLGLGGVKALRGP